MPRVGSEQYVVSECPSSVTSANTLDTQTVLPAKKAIEAWITVEQGAARVTFNGTIPGSGDAPGIVIPSGGMPAFYPFAFDPNGNNAVIKLRANATTARMTVIFVI